MGALELDGVAMGLSTLVLVPAGRQFITAGDVGREVLVVASGVASVHAPETGEYIASATAGDICGELAVLESNARCSADVVANTDLFVLAMTRNEFWTRLSSDARFAADVATQARAHRYVGGNPHPWAL